MSTALGSCLGETLADACLCPWLQAQTPCGDTERCVLLFLALVVMPFTAGFGSVLSCVYIHGCYAWVYPG